MLGTLAKWLRILGYDTEYVKNRNDDEIIRMAKEEERFIITRDKLLARKAGNIAFYMNEKSLEKQIMAVLKHFNLKMDESKLLSRCTICNIEVIPVEKEEVKGKVPENAWKTHEKFWMCPKCGRIYWMGSHWENMREIIESMKNSP